MKSPRLFVPFLTLLCSASALHAVPNHFAGPMVGDTKPNSASLWMYAPPKLVGWVSYGPESAEEMTHRAELKPVEKPAAKGFGVPYTAVLADLSPDTRYRYEVQFETISDPAWKASFKSAPEAAKPSSFRMVLTSCMKFDQPQSSWKLLLNEKPAFHLTLGDTHYADTTNPDTQLGHHLRYRRKPEFAEVIRSLPTYSMWDDHDYGPNDSDKTAKGKERSLAGWKQFWRNPGAGTEETPGAFYRFTWGEVDFFVVDGRYHRSPDKVPDDAQKRMLGDAQFAWLLDGLKNSKAKFKVIASGSTLQHSKGDGWRIYTYSRHRLFDALKENKIAGVVYMSGDIHKSLVWEHHESDRVGYPLVEVISSGVANSKTLSFSVVEFDTTVEDPTMRVRVVHGDGKVHDDKTWKLSQLEVK